MRIKRKNLLAIAIGIGMAMASIESQGGNNVTIVNNEYEMK